VRRAEIFIMRISHLTRYYLCARLQGGRSTAHQWAGFTCAAPLPIRVRASRAYLATARRVLCCRARREQRGASGAVPASG
jgi:hypothetical protein